MAEHYRVYDLGNIISEDVGGQSASDILHRFLKRQRSVTVTLFCKSVLKEVRAVKVELKQKAGFLSCQLVTCVTVHKAKPDCVCVLEKSAGDEGNRYQVS